MLSILWGSEMGWGHSVGKLWVREVKCKRRERERTKRDQDHEEYRKILWSKKADARSFDRSRSPVLGIGIGKVDQTGR